jgi:amidohydrolase
MRGTIRALDADMRLKAHESMRRVVKSIAESAGATGEVTIVNQTLVNYNDPELTKKSVPSLVKAVGADKVKESTWITAAEDFSFYGQKAPTFFFSLGALPPASAGIKTGGHHTPDFYLDESGFVSGVKAFCFLVFNPSKP